MLSLSISDISMKFCTSILSISFEESGGTKEKLFAVKLSKPASLLTTGITGWVLEVGAARLLHLATVFEENCPRRETSTGRKGKIKAVTKHNALLYLATKSGTQGKVQAGRA